MAIAATDDVVMLIRILALMLLLAVVVGGCGGAAVPETSNATAEPSPRPTQAPTVTTATTIATPAGRLAMECTVLPESEFESNEEHEVGRLADGTLVMDQWHLGFTQARVQWTYSDVVETLEYRCADGAIETEGTNQVSGEVRFDGDDVIIQWDGIPYSASVLGDTDGYALPDPDGVSPGSADDALLFGFEVVAAQLAGDADLWRTLAAERLFSLEDGIVLGADVIDAFVAEEPFPLGRDLSSYTINDFLWHYDPQILTFDEVAVVFDGFDIGAMLSDAGWEPAQSAFFFLGGRLRGDAPGFTLDDLLMFVVAFDGERWEIIAV